MYSRKDTSPNYIEFSKNQTRIGKLASYQKSYKGKNHFEPFFQLLKINDLWQFEKSQQVYLSEKEGDAISIIRNTVDHDAEQIGLVSKYEAKSGKESTLHCKRKWTNETSCQCQLYFEQILKTFPNFGRLYVCW